MSPEALTCKALHLSNGQKCVEQATHANGLFCMFHASQAFGMYKGYKRRNARLDALPEEAPEYLKRSTLPLANQTFDDVDDKQTLGDIHTYLYDTYLLLGAVIDARKLHHKHFYSLDCDYGHQVYLDKLISQRHTVLRALERVVKRTAEVLYKQERWYAWVRDAQRAEEATRDKEQKKVRQEAALFKRHWKSMQARAELAQQKEFQKQQDAYLEDVYRQSMAMAADNMDNAEQWDPIKDMEDDRRLNYIDLIRHFLWMEAPTADLGAHYEAGQATKLDAAAAAAKKSKKKPKARANRQSEASSSNAVVQRGQGTLLAMQAHDDRANNQKVDAEEPDKNSIESEEEMRQRLSQRVKKNMDNVSGLQLINEISNPLETFDKTAPMTKDEVDTAISDVKQIKLLLFCRLVLAHASLLPAAVQASSVDEFLADSQIAESDLRDICLKLEEPTLQDIRDACADFARGDQMEEDDDSGDSDDGEETLEQMVVEHRRYQHLHTTDWLMDKVLDRVNGPTVNRKRKQAKTNTKVVICGKSLWNHASEKAMSRDGWLQFSIIAKDCDLRHAIQLCRTWSEFVELNLLTTWQFFPASNWMSWGCNKIIQQLHDLSFFPYFIDLQALQQTQYIQNGGGGRGRRSYRVVESRNIMVGSMKRNDPVTERFLHYLLMRQSEVLLLVRDGKTGRTIVAPDQKNLWTWRSKEGFGRDIKEEWDFVLEIGPQYFRSTDKLRQWRFGFNDYYDVFIWDFKPGLEETRLYNVVVQELRNAWRIRKPSDVNLQMEYILRKLTREPDTMRTRLIKEGEDVESLWDQAISANRVLYTVTGEQVQCLAEEDLDQMPYLFYNKSSAAEDAVLWPDELSSRERSYAFRPFKNGVYELSGGAFMQKNRSQGLTRTLDTTAARKAVRGKAPDSLDNDEDEDSDEEEDLFTLPNLWYTGLEQLWDEDRSDDPSGMLQRTGLMASQLTGAFEKDAHGADEIEAFQRTKAIGFKATLHAGDLEPGNSENLAEVHKTVQDILSLDHTGSTDWVCFLAGILDWLDLRADHDVINPTDNDPWTHSFIAHDICQAFVTMALFFPEVELTAYVKEYLESEQASAFRESLLFDAKQRSKIRPDRRTATSFEYRKREFWADLYRLSKAEGAKGLHYMESLPMDWSIVARSTVATLYKAGVIVNSSLGHKAPGLATAMTESHRPGRRDLFINYQGLEIQNAHDFRRPEEFPDLLPRAQRFAKTCGAGARFALLRLWTAPHYYPLQVGVTMRDSNSFTDTTGRSWYFNFVPKDFPGSEISIDHTTLTRVELLKKQFGTRVVSRADTVLVMGEDADDLLRHCTAVTFALQTKPWMREVDPWKSFINVDLNFLVDLDDHWWE